MRTISLEKLATKTLQGRGQPERTEDDQHPVQNDWNGSAKVALISIKRSEAAWRIIAWEVFSSALTLTNGGADVLASTAPSNRGASLPLMSVNKHFIA